MSWCPLSLNQDFVSTMSEVPARKDPNVITLMGWNNFRKIQPRNLQVSSKLKYASII